MIMRKSKRHLSFESLESIALLSVGGLAGPLAAEHHQLARVHRAPKQPVGHVALNLSGTVQGTYRIVDHGASATFNGKGSINPIGRGQARGTIAFGTTTGAGQFTLSFGRRGKLFADISGLSPADLYTFQITGGTKTFVGDTGIGTSDVQILSSNAAQTRGRFALTLASATAD